MKDIVGYEGKYAITPDGKVWSYKRNRYLKGVVNQKNGYVQVSLSLKCKVKKYYVHRLVAEAYLKNPNNLPQINHKDENKKNNNVWNLEWCNSEYNAQYSFGQRVRCIETGEEFASQNQCARTLGISQGNLWKHLKGLRGCVNGMHFEII